MDTQYTVSYRYSNKTHGSFDVEKTVCGKNITEEWEVRNNMHNGIITCKKCLKKLREGVTIP